MLERDIAATRSQCWFLAPPPEVERRGQERQPADEARPVHPRPSHVPSTFAGSGLACFLGVLQERGGRCEKMRPTHSKPAQPVLAELGSDYSCVLCYPELLPDAFKMEI